MTKTALLWMQFVSRYLFLFGMRVYYPDSSAAYIVRVDLQCMSGAAAKVPECIVFIILSSYYNKYHDYAMSL